MNSASKKSQMSNSVWNQLGNSPHESADSIAMQTPTDMTGWNHRKATWKESFSKSPFFELTKTGNSSQSIGSFPSTNNFRALLAIEKGSFTGAHKPERIFEVYGWAPSLDESSTTSATQARH